MPSARTALPDPVQELRFRAWARRNHVPAAQRSPEWHPIVLDEMARRDREPSCPPIAAPPVSADSHAPPVPRYVPLAPVTIHVRHDAHGGPAAPHMATFDAAWSAGDVYELYVN